MKNPSDKGGPQPDGGYLLIEDEPKYADPKPAQDAKPERLAYDRMPEVRDV